MAAELQKRYNQPVFRKTGRLELISAIIHRQPDYAYIHEELKRVGVTLKLLWQEYQAACRAAEQLNFGYTKFCLGYDEYTCANNLTNHLEHRPGDTCEADWSGKAMRLVD